MNKTAKITILVLNTVFCALIVLGTAFFMSGWGVWIRAACYAAAGAGAAVGFVTFFLKRYALFKTAFILVCCGLIFLAATIILNVVGNLDELETDEEKAQRLVEIIRSTGGWSYVVYVLIQVLQVVVLPLPALVCYVPGSIIFGPLYATLLASLGVLIGSVINYFLGKIFGKKLVCWVAGKETTEKYTAYFGKRGKVLFLLMQILPFFPDDILCMVAGLTAMNFFYFIGVMVLVRPLIIAVYCYLGDGTIIPFEGWGIAVWIAIFAVCIVLAVLSFKYQDKFESWLVNKFTRKKKSEANANCPADMCEITEETVPEEQGKTAEEAPPDDTSQ